MTAAVAAAPAAGINRRLYLAALAEEVEDLLSRVRPAVVQIQGRHRVLGAGVVARSSGIVVTAQHVVAAERSPVEVVATDGRRSPARLVHADPARDLAVLDAGGGSWPLATFGDSGRVRVGEIVFTLGHPWGQPWAVSVGIVSGVGGLRLPVPLARSGGGRPPEVGDCIWSDVRLAPGNSGGPLFNARGEVVGLCTMVVGGDLAVAVPSRAVLRWFAASAPGP